MQRIIKDKYMGMDQLFILNEKLKQYPKNVENRLARANLYMSYDEYLKALEDFQFVYDEYPANPLASAGVEICKKHLSQMKKTEIQVPSNKSLATASSSDREHIDNPDINYLVNKYGLPDDSKISLEKGLRNAANNNKIDDLKSFIKLVKNINAQDANLQVQRTALHWSAMNGHEECCLILLEAGAEYNIYDAAGATASLYLKPLITKLSNNLIVSKDDKKNLLSFFRDKLSQSMKDKDAVNFSKLLSCIDVNIQLGLNTLAVIEAAVEINEINFVRIAIENNANVNVFNKYKGTPLMRALYNKNIEIMKMLISSGADTNFIAKRLKGRMLPERYAGSALHIAAEEGLIDAARILLENGTDPNARKIPDKYSKCYTPLDVAINGYKQRDMFDLFIEHEDKISIDVLQHALTVALESWKEYYVCQLLHLLEKRNCNSAVMTNARFVLSVVHNNLGEASELIKVISININELKFGSSVLTQYAAEHDNLAMLKLLISYKADMNGKQLNHDLDSPLCSAASYNSISVLSFLLEHPHRRSELNNALDNAVKSGHFDCVKLLVEAGGDINYKPCYESILTMSIQKGYNKITGYLLSKGATLSLANHNGEFTSQTTPFHAALEDNNMELAVILIMRDRKLLHIMDEFSWKKPIEEWVDKNLLQEKNVNTLSIMLAFAILAEDVNSVSLLIKHSVDIHAVVYDEMSPYQLSQECNIGSIKEVLNDVHKSAVIGSILGRPNLKPDSLTYISLKAAAKHVLKIDVNNNIGFFQNIPDHLKKSFAADDKIQKALIIASEYSDDIELEQEQSTESIKSCRT